MPCPHEGGSRCTNLGQILLKRAAGAGGRRTAIVYRRGDGARQAISDTELLERAQRVAAALRGQGLARGNRVLLMLTTQADFIDAFFGAIWADAIPVPLFPPLFTAQSDDFVTRCGKIAGNAEAQALGTVRAGGPAADFERQTTAQRLAHPLSRRPALKRSATIPVRAIHAVRACTRPVAKGAA